MDKHEIRAQEFTAQVRREIYIMRCLKHRHIVRMNEVLTSDTKLYIVMELVTGGELFDRIEKGRVSEGIARHYFQQLVDGVDFCHKKGVAHRDLKPENLLVDENGDIKITDFGFSSMKGMDVNTWLLYTQCGTPDYCAPEIIDSAQNGYTGAKVDAWSCGIILYALLCGRLPFHEPDTEKLYDLILACQVKYPPFISAGARDLLANLLVRDPDKRYDLQRVKRHPWFLVDYDGDDARLLKKRPFFNKNQVDLKGSSPSSPTVPSSREASGAIAAPAVPPNSTPLPAHNSPPASSVAPNTPASIGPSSGDFIAPTLPTTPPPSTRTPLAATPTVPSMASQSDNINVPPINDLCISSPSKYRPSSLPGSSLYSHDRQHSFDGEGLANNDQTFPQASSTSQSSSIPVLPFSSTNPSSQLHTQPHLNNHSQTSHQQPSIVDAGTPRNLHLSSGTNRARDDYYSFRSVSPAADVTMHARAPTPPAHDVFTKVEDRPATPARRQHSASTAAAYKAAVTAANGGVVNANDPTPSVGQNFSSSGFASGISGNRFAGSTAPRQPVSNGMSSTTDSPGFPLVVDDSSSDQDSVEDYENKPAPLLEMPANPRQVLRQTKEGRLPLQSVSASRQPRQRSDMTGMSAAAGGEQAISTAPLPVSQRQRRMFSRDGANSGSVNDVLSFRLSRPEGPSSPTVVYSPSPVNGSSYERYHSASPYLNTMRTVGMPEEDGPNSGYGPSSGPNHNMPWQSSSTFGGGATRDETVHNCSSHVQNLSQHLWNMVNKLRGTCDAVGPKLSKELRKDLGLFTAELNQLNKSEDVLSVFYNFLSGFDNIGVADAPGSSQSFGIIPDEEFDPRSLKRSGGAELSSEEEPLSLSPVVAETGGPYLSDLARRRNLSDLLTKWMKTADRRLEEGGDGDDGAPMMDLAELQRLMREHQGGREESNLADDLLRLMNASEDGSSTPYGNIGSQPGQSPPSPHVQSTRSGDSYTQTRYLSNLSSGNGIVRPSNPRSISNNNSQLPSEYVPGRFKEPNSMPSRGRNGNDRQTGLSGRTDMRPSVDGYNNSGSIGRSREDTNNMANSMGMHDVPYYISDKKGGVANKLRGVLQTMKAKNHRLGEHHAQFRSSLPADEIMRLLVRVLQNMGGKVTIKKETKRKMKCQLALKPNYVLYAGIELVALENSYTSVLFRRSRADKGKTDTDSFHEFFERVRSNFIDEANAMYPTLRMTTANAASRKKRHNREGSSRHVSDTGQSSVSGS